MVLVVDDVDARLDASRILADRLAGAAWPPGPGVYSKVAFYGSL